MVLAPRMAGLKRVPGPLVGLVVATALCSLLHSEGVATNFRFRTLVSRADEQERDGGIRVLARTMLRTVKSGRVAGETSWR